MGTNTKSFKQSTSERRYRRFSDSFKLKVVKEIEQRKVRVSEVCKAHEVSNASVYKWMEKYGTKQKPTRTIVESKSDTSKIIALQKRIAELERALGQKQLDLEFNEKLIDFAEKKFSIDIKKKRSKS
jgi:transposase-like protein